MWRFLLTGGVALGNSSSGNLMVKDANLSTDSSRKFDQRIENSSYYPKPAFIDVSELKIRFQEK